MRVTLIAPAVIAFAPALAAGPALAASPLEGLWNTKEVGGQVQIYACGEAFCGKVISSQRIAADPTVADVKNKDAALRSRPLKGLVIFNGLTGGPKEFKGASLYNPEDGGTYHGSITMPDNDTLKLTGCIIVPLCKSEVWHRAK